MIDYTTAATVYVLDEQFRPVYLIDDYKSLIWTERYYEAGDFEIEVPIVNTSKVLNMVKIDSFLQLSESLSESIMVVESIEIQVNEDDGDDTLVISGRSAESLLDRRVVAKKHTLNEFDVDIVIKKLVKENVTDPELYERRFISSVDGHKMVWFDENSIKQDTIMTQTVSGEYYGDNVYDAVTKLCQQFGFGYKLYPSTISYDIYKIKKVTKYTHKLKAASNTTWYKLRGGNIDTYTISSSATGQVRTYTASVDYWTSSDYSQTKAGTLSSGTKWLGISSAGSGSNKMMKIQKGTYLTDICWVKYSSLNSSTNNDSTAGAWLYSTTKQGASNRVGFFPRGTTVSVLGTSKWYVGDTESGTCYRVSITLNNKTYTGYIPTSLITKTTTYSSDTLVLHQSLEGESYIDTPYGTFAGNTESWGSTVTIDPTNAYIYRYLAPDGDGYVYGDVKVGNEFYHRCRVETSSVTSTTTTLNIIPIYKNIESNNLKTSTIVAWVEGSTVLHTVTDSSSSLPSSWSTATYLNQSWYTMKIGYDNSSYSSNAWQIARDQNIVASSTESETFNKGWFMFVMNKCGLLDSASGYTAASLASDGLAKTGSFSGYVRASDVTTSTTSAYAVYPMRSTASSDGSIVQNLTADTLLSVMTEHRVTNSDGTISTFYRCSAVYYSENDSTSKGTRYYGYVNADHVTVTENGGTCRALNFLLYDGKDLTAVVRFGPDLDNLDTTTYLENYEDYKDVCLVEGETKTTWATTPLSQNLGDYIYFNRRETYVDQTSVTNERLDEEGNNVCAQDSSGNYLYRTKTDSCTLYDAAESGSKVTDTEWAEHTSVTYSGTPTDLENAQDSSSKIYVTIGGYSGYASASSIEIEPDLLSDEEYEELLKGKGVEELADSSWPIEFDGEIVGDMCYEYSKDYKVGDIVYADTGYGKYGKARVTEMIFSYDNDSFTEYPTFEFMNQDTAFNYEDYDTDDDDDSSSKYYAEAWRWAQRNDIVESSDPTNLFNKGWFMYINDLAGALDGTNVGTKGYYYDTAWKIASSKQIVSSSKSTETFNKGWFMFIMDKLDKLD